MERSLSLTLHLCASITNSFEDCDKFLELKTSDEFWKLVQKVLSQPCEGGLYFCVVEDVLCQALKQMSKALLTQETGSI